MTTQKPFRCQVEEDRALPAAFYTLSGHMGNSDAKDLASKIELQTQSGVALYAFEISRLENDVPKGAGCIANLANRVADDSINGKVILVGVPAIPEKLKYLIQIQMSGHNQHDLFPFAPTMADAKRMLRDHAAAVSNKGTVSTRNDRNALRSEAS